MNQPPARQARGQATSGLAISISKGMQNKLPEDVASGLVRQSLFSMLFFLSSVGRLDSCRGMTMTQQAQSTTCLAGDWLPV